ncbi:MAG: hypothetical protein NZZ41_05510 [Candidatus Dojkabacteria bacterium]|nr:hypothetical protein [Candidatus Dojkabacteria bacterium]
MNYFESTTEKIYCFYSIIDDILDLVNQDNELFSLILEIKYFLEEIEKQENKKTQNKDKIESIKNKIHRFLRSNQNTKRESFILEKIQYIIYEIESCFNS